MALWLSRNEISVFLVVFSFSRFFSGRSFFLFFLFFCFLLFFLLFCFRFFCFLFFEFFFFLFWVFFCFFFDFFVFILGLLAWQTAARPYLRHSTEPRLAAHLRLRLRAHLRQILDRRGPHRSHRSRWPALLDHLVGGRILGIVKRLTELIDFLLRLRPSPRSCAFGAVGAVGAVGQARTRAWFRKVHDSEEHVA
jgi:hypothetical protein